MIHAEFPAVSRKRLIRMARDHAADLAAMCEEADPPDDDHRLVVNMLRHKFTDYDDDQSTSRHRAACERITARYPWLADECTRQVAVRAGAHTQAEQMLRDWVVDRERERAQRRDLVAASHAGITDLTVGQHVTVTVHGHVRQGVLTKVARSRVTVEFTLRSGQSRTAVVHAATVQPT